MNDSRPQPVSQTVGRVPPVLGLGAAYAYMALSGPYLPQRPLLLWLAIGPAPAVLLAILVTTAATRRRNSR